MKRAKADFVMAMDELREQGKMKISPISREANSFDCPKCGSLLSPENPASYSEIGYGGSGGLLIECRRCSARIELLWQTYHSRSICSQFKRSS